MSNECGNYANSAACDPQEDWRCYDKLPPSIKILVQNAPYKLHCKNINSILIHFGLEEAERELPKIIQEVVRKSASLTYGPDHPQAQ